MYKLGDRIVFADYNEAILAEASRIGAKRKKVCLISLKNGRNMGRTIEVKDFKSIEKDNVRRMTKKKML